MKAILFLALAMAYDIQIFPRTSKISPDSINPEFWSKEGFNQLVQCRASYTNRYKACQIKGCTFCSANENCGWCVNKQMCIPLENSTKLDYKVPLCQGECSRVANITACSDLSDYSESTNFKDKELGKQLEKFKKEKAAQFYKRFLQQNSNVTQYKGFFKGKKEDLRLSYMDYVTKCLYGIEEKQEPTITAENYALKYTTVSF